MPQMENNASNGELFLQAFSICVGEAFFNGRGILHLRRSGGALVCQALSHDAALLATLTVERRNTHSQLRRQ
eukprot:3608837-Prymnesium_polylepis.1